MHRLARLVCIVVGGLGGSVPAVIPPDIAVPYVPATPFAPVAFGLPPDFSAVSPNSFAGPQFVQAPSSDVVEPSSLFVLALGVVLVVGLRR
jgi:hypothetical protein